MPYPYRINEDLTFIMSPKPALRTALIYALGSSHATTAFKLVDGTTVREWNSDLSDPAALLLASVQALGDGQRPPVRPSAEGAAAVPAAPVPRVQNVIFGDRLALNRRFHAVVGQHRRDTAQLASLMTATEIESTALGCTGCPHVVILHPSHRSTSQGLDLWEIMSELQGYRYLFDEVHVAIN